MLAVVGTNAAGVPPQISLSFVILAMVGILFGIILFIQANQRHQLEKPPLSKGRGEKDEIFSSLLQEMNRLRVSPSERNQTARAIAQLFGQEIQEKIRSLKWQLSEKYEKIVEEKNMALRQADEQFKQTHLKYETLNKSFAALNAQRKQTEAVVHSMAEGVVVVNEKGEVLLMNPAAEKLLNMKKEEKIGKSILSDARKELLISLIKQGATLDEEEITVNSQSEETKKILRTSNAVIEDESGQTVGMVSVLSDVTREKELDELKSKFVANVSHELRNPLYNVQETINLLSEKALGAINPEQERMLALARKEIERLSRLIIDLLDFSKLEAGELRLKPAVFCIEDLIHHTLATFQLWAKNKKIVLDSKLPPEPIELEADRDRLTQVLTNLIGNALKWTPAGGRITIEAKKMLGGESHDGEFVQISVRDTGPGIPKKDRQRIFEEFVQLDSSPQQGFGGTGIGLSIAREIVELHQGKIWVESEEGRGSTFLFQIPRIFQQRVL